MPLSRLLRHLERSQQRLKKHPAVIQEEREEKRRLKKHPASTFRQVQKKPYPSLSSIHPQSQSSFFTLLPPEIRLIIYEILFGNRSVHYQCDWMEEKNRWVIYSFVCFLFCERIDFDECVERSEPSAAKSWGVWIDYGMLFSCWKGYLESLRVLYATNEFRFGHYRDLCTTFPAQIPSLGLPTIRRLTFQWHMKVDAQPHMSRQSKAKYDELWNALGTTFTSLTHIRIYIDTERLAELLKMPRGSSENDKTSYIQHAWLDGIQAMVDANDNLQVFEVHFYTKVYSILRAKVKPWLGEMEKQRRVKNSGVKYKAYKTRSQTIKWGSGCGTDISDGSSHIDFRHPMTQERSFWARNRKKLMEQARKDTVHMS